MLLFYLNDTSYTINTTYSYFYKTLTVYLCYQLFTKIHHHYSSDTNDNLPIRKEETHRLRLN